MIKNSKSRILQVIGRREKVTLTDLGLESIIAKIDTGAYSCSLHCHDIKEELIDGVQILKFKLLDPTHPQYNDIEHSFTNYSTKLVKSSNGKSQMRYVINTSIKLANKSIKADFTLTNRKKMKYPILIGRKLIKYKFAVDVSKINYLNKNRQVEV